MAQLKELYDELVAPSRTKLQQVAKRRKLEYTKEQLDKLYKDNTTGQLFGKAPTQKGAIATAGEHDKWQADLIDYKQFSKKANDGHQHALSVTNVYDRKTYTEKLKSKEPGEVWAKFQTIMGKFGAKPKRLDVDADQAFGAGFTTNAQGDGIEIHQRRGNPADVNYIAVADSAMGKIKKMVGKAQVMAGDSKWTDKLGKATDAYNKLPNDEALYGQAPNDVAADPVLKFKLAQDNGAKLLRNSKQLQKRQSTLEDEGAFRAMLPKQTFARGFKPSFGGTVYRVDSISNNQVKSGNKTFEISKVMPVSADSKSINNIPAALVKGSQAMDASKREKLQPFAARLRAFVQGGSKTVKQVGEHMKALAGFNQALSDTRLNKPGGVKQAAALMGLKVSGGVGQSRVSIE